MSADSYFECATDDGSALRVEEADTNDGRAWVEATDAYGSRIEVLLSRESVRALGRRLLEIAGDAAPATGEPPR
jgi:hypothetical protein